MQPIRFATAADFAELISHEVYVDIERLRFFASHGIPDEVRGAVWQILLPKLGTGFDMPETEDAAIITLPQGKSEMAKIIRDTIDTYQLDEHFFRKTIVRERIERQCVQYFTDNPNSIFVQNPKLLVFFFGPFIYTLPRRNESETPFLTFMKILENYNSAPMKERHFGRFMTLFRSQLPRLCAHFEEEELEPRKWVKEWHQCLFAKQLPLKCLLRLWDSYFSVSDGGFELHIYVCIAILKRFENDLLDKNYPELRAFFERIPPIDVEKTIAQAINFRCIDA